MNTFREMAVRYAGQPEAAGEPVKYRPGAYRAEALAYFRSCVGAETYERAMSAEAGRRHHYVAARVFLDQSEWERFCWIEAHGSLAGFP